MTYYTIKLETHSFLTYGIYMQNESTFFQILYLNSYQPDINLLLLKFIHNFTIIVTVPILLGIQHLQNLRM